VPQLHQLEQLLVELHLELVFLTSVHTQIPPAPRSLLVEVPLPVESFLLSSLCGELPLSAMGSSSPEGEEKAGEEEHEEVLDEAPAAEGMCDPPEAGHNTTCYAAGDSSSLANDVGHAPGGNVILPEHGSPVATPGESDPNRGRALSNDSSVVGPFQTVDQVGDHPACAVDPCQEFLLTLKKGTQHVMLSPSSDDEDVKKSQEPGVGPPLLEAMYSTDVSNVTMSKGEKHAFMSGLSIMNEQDHVLTALVSNTWLWVSDWYQMNHLFLPSEMSMQWVRLILLLKMKL
jgi:hypothetical protein